MANLVLCANDTNVLVTETYESSNHHKIKNIMKEL